MTIAVLGAGNVGKALGEALAAKGHDVVYGVRTLEAVRVRKSMLVSPGVERGLGILSERRRMIGG